MHGKLYCMCVTDIFTSYRRVKHVECVFRGFVGNGGNWTSVKKNNPLLFLPKFRFKSTVAHMDNSAIYIPVQQYIFQYNTNHSSTTIYIPVKQYTFHYKNIFSSNAKPAFAKNYLKPPIISYKRGKSLIKRYPC